MTLRIIIAQNEATARALRASLELLGADQGDGAATVEQLILPERSRQHGLNGLIEIYDRLVDSLNNSLSSHGRATVLVDAIDPAALDAAAETASWDSLIAMLILTFPEVRWIFGSAAMISPASDGRDAAWQRIGCHHDLTTLFGDELRCPLFDPTGLRDWVRGTTSLTLEAIGEAALPQRQCMAAAIDEERPYAFLHGYAAYSHGFRTDTVTSWSLMRSLFGRQDGQDAPRYTLLLEDLSLKFPDRPRDVRLLSLAKRGEILPGLERAADGLPWYRVIVTSGKDDGHGFVIEENKNHLAGRAPDRVLRWVDKPAGGMFDLWRKAGLSDDVSGFRAVSCVCASLGRAAASGGGADGGGADGSGTYGGEAPNPTEARSHGTHGRVLRVSEALIRRAEAIGSQAEGVEKAVLGAVLSTDALELNGGSTPTTAINALVLKHRFGVEVECQFSGVEYHFDIKSRLKQIAVESRRISANFHVGHQKVAQANSEMRVINGLLAVLRTFGQFDEEQTCLTRVRTLHLALWSSRSKIRAILWPLLRYVILLIQSPGYFAAAICFWIALLTIYLHHVAAGISYSWGASLGDAASSFFSLGSPIVNAESAEQKITINVWYVIGVYASIFLGFIHLGAFISYLYSIVSRK